MDLRYAHPLLVENSLPIEANRRCDHELRYHIVCPEGGIVRKGSFTGQSIYISTRLLPKGVRFKIRILEEDTLVHEGIFETI
jgi:hypothetical protein